MGDPSQVIQLMTTASMSLHRRPRWTLTRLILGLSPDGRVSSGMRSTTGVDVQTSNDPRLHSLQSRSRRPGSTRLGSFFGLKQTFIHSFIKF